MQEEPERRLKDSLQEVQLEEEGPEQERQEESQRIQELMDV